MVADWPYRPAENIYAVSHNRGGQVYLLGLQLPHTVNKRSTTVSKEQKKQPSEKDILASEARKAQELMKEALDLDEAITDVWEDK